MPVTLDSDEFRAIFSPEFVASSNAQIEFSFGSAEIIVNNNDDTSPIQKLSTRKNILYQLTAHFVTITYGNASRGAGSPGIVTQKTEGSQSVTRQIITTQGNQWWLQTRYGQTARQLLLPYGLAAAKPKQLKVTS